MRRCRAQAMVLTHSGAPVAERMPYHNVRMHGLRPLIFRGRCAAEEPVIYVRGAMYCFYRDRTPARAMPPAVRFPGRAFGCHPLFVCTGMQAGAARPAMFQKSNLRLQLYESA